MHGKIVVDELVDLPDGSEVRGYHCQCVEAGAAEDREGPCSRRLRAEATDLVGRARFVGDCEADVYGGREPGYWRGR